MSRRLDVQGLRAVAVLMVVAFHAGLPIPGGFLGVDVFFVISGFVITLMLQREWKRAGRISFARFYFRRFKRLTPALAVMVLTVMVASALIMSPWNPEQQDTVKTGIGALLLVANFVIAETTGGYFSALAQDNPLLNTWSLSVEEQFYLFFPALLVFGWWWSQRRSSRLAVPLLVGGVTVVSLAAALGIWVFNGPVWDVLVGFYGPLGRAWEFGAGALLALLGSRLTGLSRGMGLVVGLLGVTVLVVAAFGLSENRFYPSAATLVPVMGTVLVLVAGFATNPISQALGWKPLVAVGDWSYSIYLWHWPVIVFAALLWPGRPAVLLIAAAVSFAPALVSYRWLEQPIRALSGLGRRRTSQLVVSVLLPPLAVGAACLAWANYGLTLPELQLYRSAATQMHAGWRCMDFATMGAGQSETFDYSGCSWNAGATGSPVILLGDSSAGMYSEAVIAAASREDRPVTIRSAAACPFIDVSLRRSLEGQDAGASCGESVRVTLAWLETQPPATVLIANAGMYLSDPTWRLGVSGGSMQSGEDAKSTAWFQGLSNVVKRLKTAGHTIVLVQPLPRFEAEPYEWRPARCTMTQILNLDCKVVMPSAVVDAIVGSSHRVNDRVAESGGVRVVDPRPWVCAPGECATYSDGRYVYMDPWHISVGEAQRLTPLFSSVLVAKRQ